MLLQVEGLTKAFSGLLAVNEVSFSVEARQIKALVGPNGAGKTTVFNLIAGHLPVDRGRVTFQENDIANLSPDVISLKGIARTFQIGRLFKEMTVLENMMVANCVRTRAGFLDCFFGTPRAKKAIKAAEELAKEWVEFVGLEEKSDELAGNLSFGQQRLVEIARALSINARLILLDEPFAGLNETEIDKMIELIYRSREKDVAILLVEHNMNIIMQIAEEIVVMNYGQKIAEGTPAEIQDNEEVVKAYLGK